MTAPETAGEGPCEAKTKKRKKRITFVQASFRYILFFALTGVFLLGQYQLAGRIVRRHTEYSISMKHRRELQTATQQSLQHTNHLHQQTQQQHAAKQHEMEQRKQRKQQQQQQIKNHEQEKQQQKRHITVEQKLVQLKFPTTYHVNGILQLPYGDIEEPFEAWYSQKEKMSRIDYYEGMDRTYQREDLGEYGFAAKIVPEFSEQKKKIFRGCLHHIGSKRFPIRAQSIVPNEKYFKFDGICHFNETKLKNHPCFRWKHTFKVLTKINTYTLYTSEEEGSNYSIPLRYEMMGYDTLLTSYYDKYILLYKDFSPWEYDFTVFEIPTDVHCFDLSGASEASETTVSSFNPMLEFLSSHQVNEDDTKNNEEEEQDIHASELNEDTVKLKKHSSGINNDPTANTSMMHQSNSSNSKIHQSDHQKTFLRRVIHSPQSATKNNNPSANHFEYIVESIFNDFKNVFSKKYNDSVEHIKRKDIFRHNLRYINAKNRQNLTYKLHLNHFADVSDDEMQHYRGLLNESYEDNSAKPFQPPNIDPSIFPIPKKLDWREYGAVSNVRSQGICGSCYAYAVTGAIEAAHYLKTGETVKLSEQQIVDCSWGFGNKGCKGGYPYRAMQWIQKHGGVATSKSYGKYLAQEGYCHFDNLTTGAIIENYFNISSGNSSQLKLALALYGPVTVLINTRPRSFKFYDNGIYYDKECNNKLDHAALCVGYGQENGEEYWLIKNSWSISWGNKGFIKISMRNDNCGVTQKAVVVHAKVPKRS